MHVFFPQGFLQGTRIGVYQHSGVARDLLCSLLSNFGAQVIPLGRTEDFVPVDTEAVSEATARQGQQWAEEHRLDALVSTDGDADRPLLGDEHGTWLRGDIVGLLCARYLEARTVVTPVSSNTAIELCGWFEQVIRTRIGSPFVVGAMETGLHNRLPGVVGFEANGGFLLGSDVHREEAMLRALPTRDALLPLLALLAMAKERAVTLSGLLADLPKRFTASDRVENFPTELARSLLARWAEKPQEFMQVLCLHRDACATIDLTDGLRMTLTDGRIIHVRPSGNAPELRCYAEATSAEEVQQLVRDSILALRSQRR